MDIFSPEIIFSFFTLSLLEIVLGIDNLIFIALIVQKLSPAIAGRIRLIGLSLALIIRIMMLLCITWVISLTEPIFSLYQIDFSIKDLMLLAGGLFLIEKSTIKMHIDITRRPPIQNKIQAKLNFTGAVTQIIFIDFIFSFDS